MKLLEQTEVQIEWDDINKMGRHERPDLPRSPGIHLSGVLKYIAVKTEMLTADEVREEFFPMRMFLGMAWEEYCVGLYSDIHWQPGEVERDDITGSPDGGSYLKVPKIRSKVPVIEEWKGTWKSAKMKGTSVRSDGSFTHRDILNDWLWQRQVMGYCAMHPAESRHARLHVCYFNGIYDFYRGGEPRYFRYLMQYTDEEIEQTWAMIKKYKRFAEPEVA